MVVETNVTTCVRNVERLISRCEDIIGERTTITGQKWRIPKYVESLNEMISQLNKKHSSSTNPDQMRSFKQRLNIIEEVLRQQQLKDTITNTTCTNEPENMPNSGSPLSARGTPVTSLQQRSLEGTDVHGSGLLRRTLARNYKEMREELFRKEDSTLSSPAHSLEPRSAGQVETVLAKHQEIQEKIAKDMIAMTRSLKDRSMAARDIIKSDSEVLKKTIDLADTNIEGIKRETGRLQEKNRSCSWGVWLLLVLVFVVFIQMILFIRVFPKSR